MCKGGFERPATVEPRRQRATTTTANTTTTTPRGGCTKTPWWGSGSRPHSPPLEMISVATRSREPQHVSYPSQSEPVCLLYCPLVLDSRSYTIFLSVYVFIKIRLFRGTLKGVRLSWNRNKRNRNTWHCVVYNLHWFISLAKREGK